MTHAMSASVDESKKCKQTDEEIAAIRRQNDIDTLHMQRCADLCRPVAGMTETALRTMRSLIECLNDSEPSDAKFYAEEAIDKLDEIVAALTGVLREPEFNDRSERINKMQEAIQGLKTKLKSMEEHVEVLKNKPINAPPPRKRTKTDVE